MAYLCNYQLFTILPSFFSLPAYLPSSQLENAGLTALFNNQHHPELKSKYTWKYDYQHVKCEDSQLIKHWFIRVDVRP